MKYALVNKTGLSKDSTTANTFTFKGMFPWGFSFQLVLFVTILPFLTIFMTKTVLVLVGASVIYTSAPYIPYAEP